MLIQVGVFLPLLIGVFFLYPWLAGSRKIDYSQENLEQMEEEADKTTGLMMTKYTEQWIINVLLSHTLCLVRIVKSFMHKVSLILQVKTIIRVIAVHVPVVQYLFGLTRPVRGSSVTVTGQVPSSALGTVFCASRLQVPG